MGRLAGVGADDGGKAGGLEDWTGGLEVPLQPEAAKTSATCWEALRALFGAGADAPWRLLPRPAAGEEVWGEEESGRGLPEVDIEFPGEADVRDFLEVEGKVGAVMEASAEVREETEAREEVLS